MTDASLSPREDQIARAYAQGASYQQIAQELGIAPSTVRTHLATIYRKLEVSSKVQLLQHLNGAAPAAPVDQSVLISELALSLEEAIARERVFAAVLRIISDGHGNAEEVIPAVLGHALDLCDAEFGFLFEYEEGRGFRASFAQNIPPAFEDWFAAQGYFYPDPQTGLGRLFRDRAVINIVDVKSEGLYGQGDPLRRATVELGGARSFAAIPMRTGDTLIGAFTIYRQRVRPFDDMALSYASIFADHSVIAIQNARLMAAAQR